MPKGEDLGDLLADAAADGKPYIYEKSAGSGITVYILDSGINWEHQDLKELSHRDHIASGLRNKFGQPDTDASDGVGHGTAVASMVAGKVLGVAKRVSLVSVKVANGTPQGPEPQLEGYRWATEDVRRRNLEGRAVFVWCSVYLRQFHLLSNNRHAEYAYQPPYNIPRPDQSDPWVDVLAESWATGIVTVFAAGNREERTPPYPELNRMGYWNPQRFAKTNNPMITVGALDLTGEKAEFNVDVTAPTADSLYLGWVLVFDTICTGEISTYAMGFPITVADFADVEGVTFEAGTSFSAPQVGGLAAYLLGLPNLRRPADFRKIPMAVKKRITRTARNDPSKGGVGSAYNGARELPCNGFVTILPETKRRSIEDVVAGKSMIDGLVGLNVTLGEPVLPMDEGHELPVEVMVA
ncbi:MAG: hypothetical protein Q9180_006368 [Flavoplaca navasiana]